MGCFSFSFAHAAEIRAWGGEYELSNILCVEMAPWNWIGRKVFTPTSRQKVQGVFRERKKKKKTGIPNIRIKS